MASEQNHQLLDQLNALLQTAIQDQAVWGWRAQETLVEARDVAQAPEERIAKSDLAAVMALKEAKAAYDVALLKIGLRLVARGRTIREASIAAIEEAVNKI